jgi:PAS domain S-box-containing protein
MKPQTKGNKPEGFNESGYLKKTSPRSDDSYRRIVQNLPQVVFEIGLDGNWIYLNESWAQFSGFNISDCIGSSYSSYIHPQDRIRCKKTFAKMLGGDIEHCADAFRFLISDGGYLWAEIHSATVRDANHQITNIVGTINNITDRVSEKELLQANHRTLTALINDLPGMVYRCRNNTDWTMEYVSGSSQQLTGYSPEDIVNSRRLSYGSMIHVDDQQKVWEEVQNAIRENRRFEVVYRIKTSDNREKYVWECGKGIFSNNNEWLGLEGFIIDITRNRNAERNNRKQLLYDEVTGLPTPLLFSQRIENTIRRLSDNAGEAAIIIVHLDRVLKQLGQVDNTTINQVTIEIGHRLLTLTSSIDSLSHLENQRWAMLVEKSSAQFCVSVIAQQIQDLFLKPVKIGKSNIYITASIGITTCNNADKNAEALLQDASHAMNRAHALGGGRFEVFDPVIHNHYIANI